LASGRVTVPVAATEPGVVSHVVVLVPLMTPVPGFAFGDVVMVGVEDAVAGALGVAVQPARPADASRAMPARAVARIRVLMVVSLQW
jgi:hypothetical protein